MKEVTQGGNVPISALESERISFSSTFRHRHVSPTKKSQVVNLVNAPGVDESKWDHMVETHDEKLKFQSWMEKKEKEDREKETVGIYDGDSHDVKHLVLIVQQTHVRSSYTRVSAVISHRN